ncbi:RNA polymerase sigma factor [Demequina oxidasica]|uniref:RNA polymerase sigma factor n=1 Tax=Demequina oxidasica TaxID=676199 RepID=UPI000782FA42|nr:sigma-70 family RNA polymerase sigma factor [Demequina oxidasica]
MDAQLTRVAREEGGRLLALLADRVGGIDQAEECLQEAYLRAATAWDASGVPDNPAAWVYTVARNAGIDRLRREKASARRIGDQSRALAAGVADEAGRAAGRDGSANADDDHASELVEEYALVGDEQLRLMLLCCHPALAPDVQVALTLRLAGGLTTAEIAAAYLVPEATVAQRIVRAKRKIRDAGIPLTIPADLSERAAVLTAALALIFNEGYLSHTEAAGTLTRTELADQAIRLTATAADALPDEPELGGLLAVELFHRSRERARADADGVLVRLDDQDRALWDRTMVARGYAALSLALAQRRLGPWQVQAMIAAEHTRDQPDWARIVRYYDLLLTLTPGPVAELNRAVAVAEADGPQAGLDALEAIAGLDQYHLLHAARAHLLGRVGRDAEAGAQWRRAASLTRNPSELAFVAARLVETET